MGGWRRGGSRDNVRSDDNVLAQNEPSPEEGKGSKKLNTLTQAHFIALHCAPLRSTCRQLRRWSLDPTAKSGATHRAVVLISSRGSRRCIPVASDGGVEA